MYPAGYQENYECSCGQSSPLCGRCRRSETRTTMAAEDYFDEYAPYSDWDAEEPDEGWDAYYARQDRESRRSTTHRRIEVDLPGSVPLEALEAGETFRFASPIKPENVYMVISSKDLDDEDVHYVLLNNGKLYSSRPSKRVMQIDVRVSIDEKRKRGRV